MRFPFSSILGLGLLSAVAFTSALAQGQEAEGDTIDPVQVFSQACYANVPSIPAIEAMAARFAWLPMAGDDLRQFTTIDNPDQLLGWDVRISERLFRLGVVQSTLDNSVEERFAGFSGGYATSCMLILDGQDNAREIQQNLTLLARKEPSSTVEGGRLITTNWTGGNADFKVFLVLKETSAGSASLISVSLLSKPQ